MNNVKKNAVKFKNHIGRNKIAYVMTGIAAATLVLNARNLKGMKEFLEEKGIDPIEFFSPEYYEELHP